MMTLIGRMVWNALGRSRTVMLPVGLIFCCFVHAEIPPDAKPEITVSADPLEITIGDRVTVTVTITYDPNRVELLPATGTPDFGQFSLDDVKFGNAENVESGKMRRVDVYTISTFITGTFEIPPIEVRFRFGEGDSAEEGMISTPALPIHVRRLTPEESENLTIRGPKPQLDVEGNSRLPLIVGITGGVFVLLLILLVWLLTRRHADKAIALEDRIPPHQRALLEFDRLRGTAAQIEAGNAPAWMEDFTLAVRNYLYGLWRIDAPDMTTTEIVQAMRAQSLGSETIAAIREMFEPADFVKFAQYPATVREALDLLSRAEAFVHQTKPDESKSADQRVSNSNRKEVAA